MAQAIKNVPAKIDLAPIETLEVTLVDVPASFKVGTVYKARLALVTGEGKLEGLRGTYACSVYQLLKSHNGKISGPELKGDLKKVYTAEREAFIKLCESRKLAHAAQRWDAVVKCMQGMRAGTHNPDTGKPNVDNRKNNGKNKGNAKPAARELTKRAGEELTKLWKAYMADETSELSPELTAAMELVADAIETLKIKLEPARA